MHVRCSRDKATLRWFERTEERWSIYQWQEAERKNQEEIYDNEYMKSVGVSEEDAKGGIESR